MMDDRCGKPTTKGTPCRNRGWCGLHPDPPMVQLRKIVDDIAQMGPNLVGSLGADYRVYKLVEQITGPAQSYLRKQLQEIVMEGIQSGKPKEEVQKEAREIREALRALDSWYEPGA